MQAPIPIFRSFDETRALEFYVDWLGFRVDWRNHIFPGAPLYMQISRGAAVLHLSEHYGDASPGAKALIRVESIDALHREIDGRHAHLRPGIETAPWGARVIEVTDPFSNRICFHQPVLGAGRGRLPRVT